MIRRISALGHKRSFSSDQLNVRLRHKRASSAAQQFQLVLRIEKPAGNYQRALSKKQLAFFSVPRFSLLY